MSQKQYLSSEDLDDDYSLRDSAFYEGLAVKTANEMSQYSNRKQLKFLGMHWVLIKDKNAKLRRDPYKISSRNTTDQSPKPTLEAYSNLTTINASSGNRPTSTVLQKKSRSLLNKTFDGKNNQEDLKKDLERFQEYNHEYLEVRFDSETDEIYGPALLEDKSPEKSQDNMSTQSKRDQAAVKNRLIEIMMIVNRQALEQQLKQSLQPGSSETHASLVSGPERKRNVSSKKDSVLSNHSKSPEPSVKAGSNNPNSNALAITNPSTVNLGRGMKSESSKIDNLRSGRSYSSNVSRNDFRNDSSPRIESPVDLKENTSETEKYLSTTKLIQLSLESDLRKMKSSATDEEVRNSSNAKYDDKSRSYNQLSNPLLHERNEGSELDETERVDTHPDYRHNSKPQIAMIEIENMSQILEKAKEVRSLSQRIESFHLGRRKTQTENRHTEEEEKTYDLSSIHDSEEEENEKPKKMVASEVNQSGGLTYTQENFTTEEDKNQITEVSEKRKSTRAKSHSVNPSMPNKTPSPYPTKKDMINQFSEMVNSSFVIKELTQEMLHIQGENLKRKDLAMKVCLLQDDHFAESKLPIRAIFQPNAEENDANETSGSDLYVKYRKNLIPEAKRLKIPLTMGMEDFIKKFKVPKNIEKIKINSKRLPDLNLRNKEFGKLVFADNYEDYLSHLKFKKERELTAKLEKLSKRRKTQLKQYLVDHPQPGVSGKTSLTVSRANRLTRELRTSSRSPTPPRIFASPMTIDAKSIIGDPTPIATIVGKFNSELNSNQNSQTNISRAQGRRKANTPSLHPTEILSRFATRLPTVIDNQILRPKINVYDHSKDAKDLNPNHQYKAKAYDAWYIKPEQRLNKLKQYCNKHGLDVGIGTRCDCCEKR